MTDYHGPRMLSGAPTPMHPLLRRPNPQQVALDVMTLKIPRYLPGPIVCRLLTRYLKLRANVKQVADRLAEAPQWINTGNTDSGDSDPANSDSDAGQVNVYSSDGDESDTGRDVDSTSQVALSVYVLMIPLLFFSRAWGRRFHLKTMKSKTNVLAPSRRTSMRDGGRSATISHQATALV